MAGEIQVKRLTEDNPGVVSLEYPDEVKSIVQNTLESWREFLALSQNEKDILKASNDHDGVGYERKEGRGESRDTKENFDITIRGIASLEDAYKTKILPEAVKRLLLHSSILANAIRPMQLAYADYVESITGGNFSQTVADSTSDVFVRLLSYPPMSIGSILGEAHTDHSGFTIHLAETTGGCQSLDTTGVWHPLPIEKGRATAFGSMQTQLATRGVIKALCHRIISTEKTSQAGRLAIVAFTPLRSVPSYDREKHGRLQAKKPGFNYTLSPRDFKALFI